MISGQRKAAAGIRMAKAAALFAAALLLAAFAGCSKDRPLVSLRPNHVLTLYYQSGISDQALAALEVFSRKTLEISDGALGILIKESEDPLAELDAGCDLIFSPNSLEERVNGNFSSYTSPFYFRDYTHLSLTLNSAGFQESVDEMTRSLMNASPLGAYYGGNSVFVTGTAFYLSEPEEFEGVKVYLAPDNAALEYTLEHLGAEIAVKSDEDRLEGFLAGSYASIEWERSRLEELSIPRVEKPFYVCDSFHHAKIDWLMLSGTTEERLTEEQMAVLTEAAAYSIAANDRAVLELEEKGFDYIVSLGCQSGTVNYLNFSDRADDILGGSARYANLWDWENHRLVKNLTR